MSDSTRLGETKRTTRWSWIRAWTGSAADQRNQYNYLAWAGVWALSFLLANLLLKGHLPELGLDLEVEGPMAWAVAAGSNVLLACALIAFLRFLRTADELARLIQLQALAVGFGAWFFLTVGWMLFEAAGAVSLAGSDTAVLVPVFGYGIGVLYFSWRYR
jgi:hypothetical protein